MANKTKYFKKKLSATTDEQVYQLPPLVKFTVLNSGDDDVNIEIDNAIDSDSLLLPSGMSIELALNAVSIAYKAVDSTATLYVTGVRNSKE